MFVVVDATQATEVTRNPIMIVRQRAAVAEC